eukprot:Clim_evm90s147 gene=Clim_evmTU90s147
MSQQEIELEEKEGLLGDHSDQGHGHSHDGVPCDGHGHGAPTPGAEAEEEPQPPEPEITDIWVAAQHGDLDKIRYFVEEEKVDINEFDGEGCHVMHWAAINGRTNVMRYLFSHGAWVDPVGGVLEATPLLWAVRQGQLDATMLLVKQGADLSSADKQGFNALHLAVQFGFAHIAAYIIAKGVDVESRDPDGRNALHWAAIRVYTPEMIHLLKRFGLSPNSLDNAKNTPLHWAAIVGNECATEELIETMGAKLDLVNADGLTPFQIASDKGFTNVSRVLQETEDKQNGKQTFFVKNGEMLSYVVPGLGIHLAIATFTFLPILYATGVVLVGIFAASQVMSRIPWSDTNSDHAAQGIYLSTMFVLLTTSILVLMPYFPGFLFGMVFFIVCFLNTGNYYRTWMGDPGFVSFSTDEVRSQIVHLAEKGELSTSNFCPTCVQRKPVRSKHCSSCKRCVAKFDHHCPFTGNCVGQANHRSFMYFVTFIGINAILYVWASIYYLNLMMPGAAEKGIGHRIVAWGVNHTWVFLQMLDCCVHVLWTLILGLCQQYQIAIGQTTNERMNFGRYKYHEDGVNHFDKGWLRNCVNFYGCKIAGLYSPNLQDFTNVFHHHDIDNPKGGSNMA